MTKYAVYSKYAFFHHLHMGVDRSLSLAEGFTCVVKTLEKEAYSLKHRQLVSSLYRCV